MYFEVIALENTKVKFSLFNLQCNHNIFVTTELNLSISFWKKIDMKSILKSKDLCFLIGSESAYWIDAIQNGYEIDIYSGNKLIRTHDKSFNISFNNSIALTLKGNIRNFLLFVINISTNSTSYPKYSKLILSKANFRNINLRITMILTFIFLAVLLGLIYVEIYDRAIFTCKFKKKSSSSSTEETNNENDKIYQIAQQFAQSKIIYKNPYEPIE